MADIETQRRIQELEAEVRELRRMMGRQPLRVPTGGGGTSPIHVVANWAALINVVGKEGHFGYTQDLDQWYAWRGVPLTAWTYTAASYAALVALGAVAAGSTGLASDSGLSYVYSGTEWKVLEQAHWHPIHPHIAINKTALDAIVGVYDGDFGHTVDTDKMYMRLDDAWVEIASSNVVAASYAALNSLTPTDGTIGYIEDKDWFYGRRAGAWRVIHPFTDTTAPSSVGEQDGDYFYNTSTDKGYRRINGAWKLDTHFN